VSELSLTNSTTDPILFEWKFATVLRPDMQKTVAAYE